MTLIEKLEALTPEQRQRLDAVTSEQELDAFLSETGEDLTAEETSRAWKYIQARQAKPDGDKAGKTELADEELENVAGGHGGMCHDSKGREVVTLIQTCVHDLHIVQFCSSPDIVLTPESRYPRNVNVEKNIKHCRYLSYEKGVWYCNYKFGPWSYLDQVSDYVKY